MYQETRRDLTVEKLEAQNLEKLKESLILKCKHPLYSRLKGYVPLAIFVPSTVSELDRLAAFRMAGCTSALITVGAWLGFTLPVIVTFSMFKMYSPDKLKFPCKVIKWGGGFLFFGASYGIDYATADLEKNYFGAPLPIDAQTTMGTLPSMDDYDDAKKSLEEIMEWSKGWLEKSR